MLYYIARFVGGGTILGVVPPILLFVAFMIVAEPKGRFDDAAGFWVLAGFGLFCRMFWSKLKPAPRRVRQPKASKPEAIPVVAGSSCRSDDPSEAAMIARLHPNLRSLLAAAKRHDAV